MYIRDRRTGKSKNKLRSNNDKDVEKHRQLKGFL